MSRLSRGCNVLYFPHKSLGRRLTFVRLNEAEVWKQGYVERVMENYASCLKVKLG